MCCHAARFTPCSSRRANNLHRSLAAIDAHPVTGFQAHCSIAAAHYGWNSQLTRHNGGVRERSANIRDNGGKAREERCPADIGDGRDENLARLELVCVLNAVDAAHGSLHAARCAGWGPPPT